LEEEKKKELEIQENLRQVLWKENLIGLFQVKPRSQTTQSNLALHRNIQQPSHHIASLQCKGRKSNQVRM
jgi:hypothetical protein